jgi:prolyl oligopeptidase
MMKVNNSIMYIIKSPRISCSRALIAAAVLTITALSAFATQAQTSAPNLPKAAVRNVQDVHHGVKVDDPYRYFENVKDVEVAAWMKAHSDHAHKTLQGIPGRARMLTTIQKFEDASSARVVQVVRAPGDVYFYEKRGAKDNQFKLYTRKGLTGEEKLLVDPELLAQKTGKPHAINYFSPSPDGSHVAYGVSQAGSEEAVLHIINVQSGKLVGKPVDRAQFGGVDWAPDGKTVFFNRLQMMKKGMPETEKYQRSLVWRMPVAGGVTKATPVFGMGVGGAKLTGPEIPFTSVTPDGRYAFGIVINGTQREWGLYTADGKAFLAGKPKWARFANYSDEVTSIAYKDGKLYLKSHKGAPRSQVLMLDMAQADIAKAKLIIPQSDRVITNVGAAADALYVEARDGNVKLLLKRAYADNAALAEVKLPVEGAFQLFGDEGGAASVDSRLPGAVIDLQGWTRARQIYAVAADGTVTNTGLQPQGPFDAPADVVTTEVKVKSHDGVMVPMSIIHKKDVKLDGNNPTLLYGYASYGITEEPFFSYGRLAWMDAGGVFAIANPRGSGVYGQDWYKAGFQTTKPNTWKDFIACAEFLIAQKYTTPAKLGILGGSAGGILVGRAMTDRPDLFAAVVPAVGALDGIRFESTPNGVPNIPEFGTIKNEAGFKALLAMSTYANIKDGTKYPAVLLTHGVNDPRVEVWQTTKAAARLMAASTSGKPVLMRLDYAAGHGIGNTKKQQQEERADIYSFLLWQMGVAEFQPK